MKLLPKQENAVYYLKDKTTTEVLYGGAAGGGKSALGCLWLIEMCQKYKGSRWLMGRSKLKALKETTLNTFFEITSKLEISDQFTYNAQSNIIYWNNGSEILLKDLFLYPSDPNFDSLGSLEITGAFVDECNQIVQKAWQVVKSRCRYKTKEFGLIPKLFGSCNPSKNWVYKDFYKPSKDGTLKDYRRFVQSLPTDNPHLDPSYIETLLQLDLASKERLYYGNWEYDNDPAKLIDFDSIQDYFNPNHIQPLNKKKYITVDVARKGKDKSVIRVWDGWLCISVVEIPQNTITELANKVKELQRKYRVSNSQTIADEDGVGGGLIDIIKCKGFVNNSRPLKVNGKIENFDNLKSQCGYYMANMINNKQAGEINQDNTMIDVVIEELETVKQRDIDRDGKIRLEPKDKQKELIGRSPDHWDSILMRYYFNLKKPITARIIV